MKISLKADLVGGSLSSANRSTKNVSDQELEAISDERKMLEKCIRISVTDTGIGIRPEDLERIFSPFEQAENSASRNYQGTGLGLSLTKSLVELHGGKIWAESKGEGEGSAFSLLLPMLPKNIEGIQ